MNRTDSTQKEQLGLPYWTTILAINVVVDRSTCLDTPTLACSKILEHLTFSWMCEQIKHQSDCPAQPEKHWHYDTDKKYHLWLIIEKIHGPCEAPRKHLGARKHAFRLWTCVSTRLSWESAVGWRVRAGFRGKRKGHEHARAMPPFGGRKRKPGKSSQTNDW